MQVWNVNRHSGVVGVFNVQGASFSRARRAFHTHDSAPSGVTARVTPADVPPLALGQEGTYAAYRDSTQARSGALTPNPNPNSKK